MSPFIHLIPHKLQRILFERSSKYSIGNDLIINILALEILTFLHMDVHLVNQLIPFLLYYLSFLSFLFLKYIHLGQFILDLVSVILFLLLFKYLEGSILEILVEQSDSLLLFEIYLRNLLFLIRWHNNLLYNIL